jgi:hypothetical protein
MKSWIFKAGDFLCLVFCAFWGKICPLENKQKLGIMKTIK